MFLGRTARRFARSRAATPVKTMAAPSGRLGDLNGGASGGVAEFEALGVIPIHLALPAFSR